MAHIYSPANHTFLLKLPDGMEKTIEGYEGALSSGTSVGVNESFDAVFDINRAGRPDIISAGYPQGVWETNRPTAVWYETPGE